MKLEKIIIVIFIIGLIGCSKKNNEIIISGKIIGNVPNKIEYTVPVNGTWFYGAKKSVEPDSIGNFQITMKIDNSSFITLYTPKAQNIMLVEPNQTYEINFNLASKEKRLTVISGSSKGQNIYNQFPTPDFHIPGIMKFLKDSTVSIFSENIKVAEEKEIQLFKELLDNQEISERFFELVKLDRECYYSALKGTVAKFKFYESIRDDNEELRTNSLKIWKEAFNSTPLTASYLTRSPWFYSLAENFIEYGELKDNSFDIYKLNKVKNHKNPHSDKLNGIKKHLSGEGLEYYNASYICLNSWQNKDSSKELITLYEMFKKDYIKSLYTEYLTPMVKPIVEYHKKIKEDKINEEIKFIADYKNTNTFKELIKTLKGQKLFVDIWGTWCGPCKKELQQKDKYAELLKSKNIAPLYICEGRNSKEKVWKEMIKFYELEGHHILANEKLVADIIERFGNKGSFAYPRYLLIDENGKVVNTQASYPSNTEQLEKEINENYVW